MVLVKKKGNFYRAVIKLLGILFFSSSVHANTPRLFPVCRRPCWRRPLRKAFVLRRATPTRPGFSRPAGAHVGADLSAKPLSFVKPRQHAPAFPDLPAPILASTFPQSLCPSSSHANTPQLFPVCRRPCWRLVPRKALSLRPATPTWSGFPRFAGAHVGVALLAKTLSFAELRQHAPAFPDLLVPMLASTSSQSLYPSLNRANTPWVFPICRRLCWRRLLRKAFVLRRATPTRPSFFRFAGAHVGVALLAKPLSFAGPRQHAPAFPDLPVSLLAPTSSQSLCPSLSHANTQKYRTEIYAI